MSQNKYTRPQSQETRKRLQRMRLAAFDPRTAPAAPEIQPAERTRHTLASLTGRQATMHSILAVAAARLNGGAA